MILFILCLIMPPPKVKSWTLKSGTKPFAFFDKDGTSRQLQLGTSCHLPTGCYLWPEGQNQWKNAVWECKTGGTWWNFARTNRNESFRSPNIGGTAIFGLGSWWPRGVVKGWSPGSCGHGIFRWEPLARAPALISLIWNPNGPNHRHCCCGCYACYGCCRSQWMSRSNIITSFHYLIFFFSIFSFLFCDICHINMCHFILLMTNTISPPQAWKKIHLYPQIAYPYPYL